jgi:hypothetical protein
MTSDDRTRRIPPVLLCAMILAMSSPQARAQQVWLVSHTSFFDHLHAAAGDSAPKATSANGRFVAFVSDATDLIDGLTDENAGLDLFLWDRANGSVRLVSHAAGSPMTAGNDTLPVSPRVALSDDGRWLAFGSRASNLIVNGVDTNSGEDTFLWDRETDVMTLVSHTPGSAVTSASGFSGGPRISRDGQYVAFQSNASNLIAGGTDQNFASDAFLWNRVTGAVTLISHSAVSPTTTGSQSSFPTAMSADGRFVAFGSAATNLVPGGVDSNLEIDAFLWDRDSDTVTLVSRAFGTTTTAANGISSPRAMSSDGQYVLVGSSATDLIVGTDTNGWDDAFLWDRQTGAMTLISHTLVDATVAGNHPSLPYSISDDGRLVALASAATDLINGTNTNVHNDVFLWSRDINTNLLISHAAGVPTTEGNAVSEPVAVSRNARFLVFQSEATNLIAGGLDLNATTDAFLWDRSSGEVSLLSGHYGSATQAGSDASSPVAISEDGRHVALTSLANDLLVSLSTTEGDAQAFVSSPSWIFGDGFETGTTPWVLVSP